MYSRNTIPTVLEAQYNMSKSPGSLQNHQHLGEPKGIQEIPVRLAVLHIRRRIDLLNLSTTAIAWKLGENLYQWASRLETRTVDGMERGGNVTSGTEELRRCARIPGVRCALSSSLHSMSAFTEGRRAGEGSGLGSTLRRLHQSLPLSRRMGCR